RSSIGGCPGGTRRLPNTCQPSTAATAQANSPTMIWPFFIAGLTGDDARDYLGKQNDRDNNDSSNPKHNQACQAFPLATPAGTIELPKTNRKKQRRKRKQPSAKLR